MTYAGRREEGVVPRADVDGPNREDRMAYAGRRSESDRRAGRRLDLDRVLAGHAMPTPRELIDLIHEVNPTGRGLDPREAARRYALKTRLQSLLVERFAEELEVVPDDQAGVVLLRHKYLGLAASHAMIADLEDDARAWVRMQLDLGAIERAWSGTPGEAERPARGRGQVYRRKRRDKGGIAGLADADRAAELAAALDEGRTAEAEYDYEAARSAFERAHDLAPEAPAPLAALLDLLVNRLGLDGEAVAIAETAASAALQSPAARAALALAAARLGERERALAWGDGLDGASAAEVLRTLAAGAIRAGDLAYAASALEQARRSLPVDPERIAVEEELARARAAVVADEEAKLDALTATGDLAGAAELARRILEQHPGSTRARAVLKDAAARERQERQRRQLDEARAAVARGRGKQARAALARARELGAAARELAEIERAIGLAEEEERRSLHEKTLAALAARLSGATSNGERRAAFAEYLALERGDREAVRARGAVEELAWLDEVAPGTTRGEAIAAAVIAARAAAERLAAGDLDGAKRVLGDHRDVLRHHVFGQALLGRFDEAWRAREQDRALVALAKAGAALRARDVAGAQAALAAVARDRLPPSSIEEFDGLSAALSAAREHQAAMGLVEGLVTKGEWVRARALLLDRLPGSIDAEQRAEVEGRLAEVDTQVRLTKGIDHVPPAPYLASEAPEMTVNLDFDRSADTWLLPGGRIAVLPSVMYGQLALRLVDVESGEIRRMIAWCVPEAVATKSLGIADGRLWLANLLFGYLEISCDDWMPCRKLDLRPDATRNVTLDACVALPGAGVAWLRTRQEAPPHTERYRAFDLVRGRTLSTPDQEADVLNVPGTDPPLLAQLGPESTVFLLSRPGVDELSIKLPPSGAPLAMARAPDGNGYLVLYYCENEAGWPLQLLHVDAEGNERGRLRFPNAPLGAPGLATIPSRRLVCVISRPRTSAESRLVYVREEEDGQLVEVANVAVPGLATVMQDEAATTAVALCRSKHGKKMVRLDDMPTVFPASYEDIAIPHLLRFVECSPPPVPALESQILAMVTGGRNESDPSFADAKLETLARAADGDARVLATYRRMRWEGLDGRADRLIELMEQHGARSFFVRLAVAEREALAGRWVGDDLEREGAAHGASEHVMHVWAGAAMRAGDLDAVIARLDGYVSPGLCCLDAVLELARALRAERLGEPAYAEETAQPCLGTLVRSIFAADRALAGSDRNEVLRILDQAWIRHTAEVQSMARLAELYLEVGGRHGPVDRFRASTLLAQFVQKKFPSAASHQLWLGEHTWPRERIEAAIAAAEKWLRQYSWWSP